MDITPLQLNELLTSGNAPVLIDVREPEELEISVLPGVRNIPMNQVPSQVASLDRDADTVFVCRSGARSDQVVQYLRSLGFTRVQNLLGGMNRWADDVDPLVRKY